LYFLLNRGCVEPGQRPVLLVDAVCTNLDCKRLGQAWQDNEGTGRCSGSNCSTESCRVEIVYL